MFTRNVFRQKPSGHEGFLAKCCAREPKLLILFWLLHFGLFRSRYIVWDLSFWICFVVGVRVGCSLGLFALENIVGFFVLGLSLFIGRVSVVEMNIAIDRLE